MCHPARTNPPVPTQLNLRINTTLFIVQDFEIEILTIGIRLSYQFQAFELDYCKMDKDNQLRGFNMDGIIAALLCITSLVTPPAFVFALHHRLQTPCNRKTTRLRIALYSMLLYVFIGVVVTTLSTFSGELSYVERSCREPYDCNNITVAAHAELWLRMALYPMSQDKCFTGNDFACQFIDREVMGIWSHGDAFAEDKGNALLVYYFFAMIFAIPPLILYALLRRIYLKPDKQKRKNDALAKSKVDTDT